MMKKMLSYIRFVALIGFLMHVGCDGVVGSTKRVDVCGVCGGDNSTCRLVSGLFTRPQLPVGYNLIAQIPRGACNITISELKQSRNYLALRKADGNYIINGNWAINWSGEYEAVGTRFTYRRQDANSGEVIDAPGPLLEPVDLMLIYQQPNPGIKYEYMLPMKSADGSPAMMSVPTVPRTSADNGILAPPLLVPSSLNNPTDELSVKNEPTIDRSDNPLFPYGSGVQGTESQGRSSQHLGHQNATPIGDEAHKPQPRNRGRKRKFMWKTTGYTECSKTCGGGTQLALVRCVKEHNQQIVLDKRCPPVDKPLPQTIRCNVKPCPAEWVGGEWSECSVTCGEGIQKRDLMCKQEISATLTMKVMEGACLSPPILPRTQKCILPPCPHSQNTQQEEESWNSKWQTGSWGKCSVACGQGVRSRSVKCLGPGNIEADDCPLSDKPAYEETCDLGSCATGVGLHGSWFFTEWTQYCSEDCGTGVQTRKVHCSGPSLDSCDASSKPDESRACSSDKQCSGKWFTGPWGQCSSGCGHGRQTRDVICATFLRGQYRVALDMNCPSALKPETERPCEAKPCGPEWFLTDWTHCSRECGTGVQKREVKCLDEKQQISSGCSEDKQPASRRTCNTHDCPNSQSGHPQLKPESESEFTNGAGDQALPIEQDDVIHRGGDCVDKFRNCHLVVQARLCKYKYYRNSCCHSCHKKS